MKYLQINALRNDENFQHVVYQFINPLVNLLSTHFSTSQFYQSKSQHSTQDKPDILKNL